MTTTETTAVAAGIWDIDPVHSSVGFAVRHMMVSKVRGRFNSVSGELVTGQRLTDSHVSADIDVASLDTGNDQRDEHVRSADFLDAANHPTISFRSTGVRQDGADLVVDGELTVHGVTRPVALRTEFTGTGPDTFGGTRIGFSATTTISRGDFGVSIALPLEGGGAVVADKIRIELDVQGVLRQDAQR